VSTPIPFENTYAALPESCFSRERPSHVPKPEIVRINHELAAELRIDGDWFQSADAVQVFSGNEIASGSDPIAQAYAGHQFGHFVPQLGDGRAILLGEVIDLHGQRRDIALKGCGRTAFSRGGDGKCALGPAMREYLVSEAMHALGVPTTRALAVVTTGEIVRRDEPLAGAVFTRVAASHLRVGTFAYFAARDDRDSLRSLLHYAVSRHGGTNALGLLQQTIQRQASLIAHWMSLGFIHGVMNTDNCSISGETIDFGPCAFMDTFHPTCVFSAIDRQGRYAWARQPEMAQWNMARLGESLMPLMEEESESAHAAAEAAVSEYGVHFQKHFIERFSAKLGIANDDSAPAFITESLRLMAQHHCDFSLFFLRLTDLASHGDPAPWLELFHDTTAAHEWLAKWRELSPHAGTLRHANPVLIPRNHQVERAIQDGYRGNYSTFHRLADAWKNPWQPPTDYHDLIAPPEPHEVVRQTFCGT
jgi:uncharacterized protein YdiU (UPF0061 family)